MPDATLDLPRRVHLVGIGGAGMAGLAQCLLSLGHEVSGSDLKRSAETARLSSLGARISFTHAADNAAHTDLVVVSDAVAANNAELEEARLRDIPVIRRAACLDILCSKKASVLIAGAVGLIIAIWQWAVWSRRSRQSEVLVDDRRVADPAYQRPVGEYRDPPR